MEKHTEPEALPEIGIKILSSRTLIPFGLEVEVNQVEKMDVNSCVAIILKSLNITTRAQLRQKHPIVIRKANINTPNRLYDRDDANSSTSFHRDGMPSPIRINSSMDSRVYGTEFCRLKEYLAWTEEKLQGNLSEDKMNSHAAYSKLQEGDYVKKLFAGGRFITQGWWNDYDGDVTTTTYDPGTIVVWDDEYLGDETSLAHRRSPNQVQGAKIGGTFFIDDVLPGSLGLT